MNRTLNIIFGVFLAVGLLGVGASVYAIGNTQSFLARAVTARGEIIGLEYRRGTSDSGGAYYPIVKYRTATGEEHSFHSNSGTSPPSYRVGETVEVLYDPANPLDARIHGFFSLWLIAIVFGILGSVFSLIGAGGLILPRVWARQAEDLKRHGTPVDTEFQDVERNGGFEVNGRSPWRIVSRWLDPVRNELHLFQSENLWFDPTPFIKSKRITVFVDPHNPKRYSMDVSFLPKLAS